MLEDADNYPFIVVGSFALLVIASIALTNWLPKSGASLKFPPVCRPIAATVPTAQVTECLEELGEVRDAQGKAIPPISERLAELPVSTLQAIYLRITGASEKNNDATLIAQDIMAAAFNAPRGANIPEAGLNIAGTWPNLSVQ